jgi:hypothetical protein
MPNKGKRLPVGKLKTMGPVQKALVRNICDIL